MSVLARLVGAAVLAVAASTVLVAPAGAAAVAPGCSTSTSTTTTTVTSSPTVTTTTTAPTSATVTTTSTAPTSATVTVTTTTVIPTFSLPSSFAGVPLRNADQPAVVAGDPCTTTSTTTSTSTAPTTTSTATTTASPSPSPTPTAPAPTLKLSGVPASAHHGDSFTITITGLSPGGHFTVEMHSVTVVLGEADADDAGHAVINVTVPDNISTGLHQIVVIGENPPESATAAIVVLADPATSSDTTSSDSTATTTDEPVAVLSNTGAPAATPTLVLVGSGCLVLGLGFLYLARRRRNQPGDHV